MDLETAAWLARAPLVFCLLIGHHYRARSAALYRLWVVALVVSIVAFGAHSVTLVVSALVEEEAWDFLCFWIAGQVAGAGLNPYDPASFQAVQLPFEISESFEAEMLDVGFWYPPTSIFLVVPLGWLDYSVAYALWQLVSLTAMVACIGMLALPAGARQSRRLILERLGLTACLVLILPATVYTLEFAQTNFLLLLAVLVLWCQRSRAWGGLALGLGCVVKPIMAVCFLPALIHRSHKVVWVAMAGLGSLLTIATLTWGSGVVPDFLGSRHRVPEGVYTESVNQSLLATIQRISPRDEPLAHPVYMFACCVLLLATAWLIFRSRSTLSPLPWLLTLLTGLLIYPGTLNHYMVLLLAPMLHLWWCRRRLPIHGVALAATLAATYALLAFRQGTYSIVAVAIYWLIFFALSCRFSRVAASPEALPY